MLQQLITLAALICLAWAPPADCDECAIQRGRVTLCRPHQAAEKATLKAARKALKSEDALVRQQAYERVGALTESHGNAPSPKVAELLGKGLEDDEVAVVETCLRQLLRGQHPDTVLDVLLDGLEDAETRCDEAEKAIEKIIGLNTAGAVIITMDELDAATNALERRPLIFRALGQLRDPRSYAALEDYLGTTPTRLRSADMRTAARMLLGFDTPEGVRLVLDTLRGVRKRARGPWEVHLGFFAQSLTEELRTWASSRSAGEVPDLQTLDEDAWELWIETHLADSEPLVTLGEPVLAELVETDIPTGIPEYPDPPRDPPQRGG